MQLNFTPRSLAAMRSYLMLAPLALMLPLQPAIAQDRDDIRARVGLGAQIRPEYIGAEEAIGRRSGTWQSNETPSLSTSKRPMTISTSSSFQRTASPSGQSRTSKTVARSPKSAHR